MKSLFSLLFICLVWQASAQFPYEVSPAHPYGLPNPAAPPQILDFAPLIGSCECISESRNPDGSWGQPVDMIWRFKYIMNGMAVQDETLKTDGKHAGSIRQFIADSSQWYVHYYSANLPSTVLPAWEGNKTESGDIVLYRDQKAPNGMEGAYKITFSEISSDGFNWLGAWVSKDESIVYPTWKISCKKKIENSDSGSDREKIMEASRKFSESLMAADYQSLAEVYTEDGKIFPANSEILEGREAIAERFRMPPDQKVIAHEITPEAINILGDHAFDYGYYSGKSQNSEGEIQPWKGKYVVVWKKTDGQWKMYLDIWNRVKI